MKLFNFLSESGDKYYTTEELAEELGGDPGLLARLLRYYAAASMVNQDEEGRYSASNITRNLALPGTEAGIKHYSMTMTPAYNAIPEFLAKTEYANPSESAPFNLAYDTDMPVFEWRKHNPKNAKVGQAFMAAQRMGQKSVWDGQTPMGDFEMSAKDIARDRVLMADVGAGLGHQSIDFRKHHPELKGRIVIEDLKLVQDMITNHDELKAFGIELKQHDFMQKQPVEGAKVYYLRNVIHNWNDKPSTTILSQISKAMAKDSVVIIDDVVMPRVGATWKQASMDLAMMTMLAAVERTEEDFSRLLASAGLELRDIWTYDEDYGDSLIVAVPAKSGGRSKRKAMEAPATTVRPLTRRKDSPIVSATSSESSS